MHITTVCRLLFIFHAHMTIPKVSQATLKVANMKVYTSAHTTYFVSVFLKTQRDLQESFDQLQLANQRR